MSVNLTQGMNFVYFIRMPNHEGIAHNYNIFIFILLYFYFYSDSILDLNNRSKGLFYRKTFNLSVILVLLSILRNFVQTFIRKTILPKF